MKTIDELKALIIEAEVVDDVLIKHGNIYDVVNCSVLDYEDGIGYTFHIEGCSFIYNINEIDDWRLISECFN